jgi:tetratricopeptide (TPR) repeat protein
MSHIVDLSEQAKRASDSGHYAESAMLYRKVVDLIPASDTWGRIIHYLSAAGAHLEARNYEEAIDDCRCAIASDPNSPIAWRWLGHAFMDGGRLAEAEGALKKSLALGATSTACEYLASLCIKDRNFGDAERYCRQALSLDPDFDEAYFNLGSSLWGQGRTDEALQAYQAACSLSPDYELAHREAGALLLDEGKFAAAETHLRKALALAPNDKRTIELMTRLIESRPGNTGPTNEKKGGRNY